MVFRLFGVLGATGVLDEATARYPSAVGVVGLLVTLLWASRRRWILSILLWVLTTYALYTAPVAFATDLPALGGGLLVGGSLFFAGAVALVCFLSDRFGVGNWDPIFGDSLFR